MPIFNCLYTMMDVGREFEPAGRRRRRRGWRAYGLGLLVTTLLLIGGLQWWLPIWAKRGIEEAAQRFGVEMETSPVRMGLTSGQLSELRGSAPGSTFSVENAAVSWSMSGIAHGQFKEVMLEGVEATIDVARFWPLADPFVEKGDEPVLRLGPTSGTQAPRVSRLPELLATPPVVEKTASASDKNWWQVLPVEELLVPSARVTARYGESEWPASVRLSYSTKDFKREAWLKLKGEGVELEASARQLSAGLSWTAQGAFAAGDPLGVLADFFPENHPAHPHALRQLGLKSVSMADFRAEGVVRGERGEWEELGLLFEGGRVGFTWSDDGAADLSEWIVALRGSPNALELNAGVAIDSWRDGPWTLDAFQATLARDAKGIARFEAPSISWRHRYGISGTMAARAFLRWPPEPLKPISAEVQMAFTQLMTPLFALDPFRFYLNLRESDFDGKLSSLSADRWPDWTVTNATVEGKWANGRAPRELNIDATLEYRATTRAVVHLVGSIASSEDGGLQTAGTIRIPEGPVLAAWSGGKEDDGGHSLRLSESAELARILPWMASFMPFLERWQGEGIVNWEVVIEGEDLRSLAATLRATARGVSLMDPAGDWEVRDLAGDWRAEARPFPRSRGTQRVEADSLRVGPVEWTDVRVQLSWPVLNRVSVEAVSGNWLGGTVAIDPFAFDPAVPHFTTVLRWKDLDPEEVGAAFEALVPGAGEWTGGNCEIRYRRGEWSAGPLMLQNADGEVAEVERHEGGTGGYSTLGELLSSLLGAV